MMRRKRRKFSISGKHFHQVQEKMKELRRHSFPRLPQQKERKQWKTSFLSRPVTSQRLYIVFKVWAFVHVSLSSLSISLLLIHSLYVFNDRYMFAYMDTDPDRPSLHKMFEEYMHIQTSTEKNRNIYEKHTFMYECLLYIHSSILILYFYISFYFIRYWKWMPVYQKLNKTMRELAQNGDISVKRTL